MSNTTNSLSYNWWKMAMMWMVIAISNHHYQSSKAIELHANCGFPGKPYRSKIVPEEKLVYEEGETVSYQCSDYWAPPQMRKCVNGLWVGSPARCGDFVMDLVMRDAKILDMSSGVPIEKFHFRKMNLTGGSEHRNNAFAADRFVNPAGGLKVTYNHEYMWNFNFSRPAVKLFVKTNFNFINFTRLDSAIRNSFSFYIDVEISPYRTCNLEYQSTNVWRDQGTRIDSFFTCEAHSYHDLVRDIENPSNYMIMRTKSSHNIPHELVELFFGHVYGNETEPICGEPEVDFGQSSRTIQEFREYNIECLNDKEWKDITPNSYKHYVYQQKCIGDMIWNGTRPRCIPIRTCPIQNIINQNRNPHHANTEHSKNETNPLVVESVLRYYNFIENQTIYAIVGTEIVYSCASVDYILVGKDTRTCRRDMTWSGTEPVCKYIKTVPEVVESPDYLYVVIICMTILLFIIVAASGFLFVFCTKHLHITTKKNFDPNVAAAGGKDTGTGATGGDWQGENFYDNIEMNFNHPAKNDVFYDIYETVDSNKDHHHRFPDTTTNAPAAAVPFPFNEQTALTSAVSAGQNKENDYIRMFGALKVEHNPASSVLPVAPVQKENSPGRNKPKTLREPSYLEVMQ